MEVKNRTSVLEKLMWKLFALGWGLFSVAWMFFLGGILQKGFFTWESKEEKSEWAAAQKRYWSVEREPLPGFKHAFVKLRNGLKLHYITNAESITEAKNVAVFIHGFPDSCLLWRDILTSPSLKNYILIAVDLPGYGGSDGLPNYSANEVMETLAQFILAIRTQFLQEEAKMVVVSHDWGGLITARLASEANQLADRFVVTGAVIPEHMASNAFTKLESAKQMLHTYFQSPWKNSSLLKNMRHTIAPVLKQVGKSFYIFCFNLPEPLPTAFVTFGNFWLLRVINKCQVGLLRVDGKWKRDITLKEAADYLAITSGPSIVQYEEALGQYPEAVGKRAANHGMTEKIRLYREGLFKGPWEKSLETVIALSEIPVPEARSGSGAGNRLFDIGPKGALRAPTTVVYGENDLGFDPGLALDGISDYLPKNSQVLWVAEAGHWMPHEEVPKKVIEGVVEWALGDEKEPLKQRFVATKEVTIMVEQ